MTRILNTILVLAFVAGIYLLVRERRALVVVRAQRDDLAKKYGVLEVKDPKKYLITRIDTGDPTHFLWRCYFPDLKGVAYRQDSAIGGSSTGTSSQVDAGEFLKRIRFDFDDPQLNVHHLSRNRSGRMGMGSAKLAEFVKDHWDELEFDVLAETGTVEVSPDEVLTFLAIRIPEHLLPELTEWMGRSHYAKRLASNDFYSVQTGTQAAFDAFDAEEKTRLEKRAKKWAETERLITPQREVAP